MSSPTPARDPVEQVLLTCTRIGTFVGQQALTNASGFFFESNEGRLFVVTSRHVLFDDATGHLPDRIEIELHVDPVDLTRSIGFSMPLYAHQQAVWRQGRDTGGDIDVATLEVERAALPPEALVQAFREEHLLQNLRAVHIGSALTILGFPLSFHDDRHHLPIARQATLASSLGLRFQGQGYFLTDARTHRGLSGAPVLLHDAPPLPSETSMPWRLLGVHSARMDMGGRDERLDEALGLNCAWYADILRTLTR